MKLIHSIVVCAIVVSGCSPALISGIDRVQSGTETTWRNDLTLSVRKREGFRLEGVKTEETHADGTHYTHTSESATMSLGTIEDPKAAGFFTVVIPEARTVAVARSGLRLTNTESVTLVLSK